MSTNASGSDATNMAVRYVMFSGKKTDYEIRIKKFCVKASLGNFKDILMGTTPVPKLFHNDGSACKLTTYKKEVIARNAKGMGHLLMIMQNTNVGEIAFKICCKYGIPTISK
jgi:hypothetical protein